MYFEIGPLYGGSKNHFNSTFFPIIVSFNFGGGIGIGIGVDTRVDY